MARIQQAGRRAPMAEFWSIYLLPGIIILAQILAIVVPLLLCVAMLTYAERKIMAAMQLRMGPNVVGPFGGDANTRPTLHPRLGARAVATPLRGRPEPICSD